MVFRGVLKPQSQTTVQLISTAGPGAVSVTSGAGGRRAQRVRYGERAPAPAWKVWEHVLN